MCVSAWVSTPPVTARVSTMVTVIPFLWLRDGTHPLAARTCEPRPLAQARQIRPAAPVGAIKPGPGRRIVIKTARAASADSEVRPGPRPPTLRPRQVETGEAGPEALPTPSLPTTCAPRCGRGSAYQSTDQPFRNGAGALPPR